MEVRILPLQLKITDMNVYNWTSPEGFSRLVETYMKDKPTQAEAFRAANRDYENVYGRPRYSGYESYRVIRGRLIKSGKI